MRLRSGNYRVHRRDANEHKSSRMVAFVSSWTRRNGHMALTGSMMGEVHVGTEPTGPVGMAAHPPPSSDPRFPHPVYKLRQRS